MSDPRPSMLVLPRALAGLLVLVCSLPVAAQESVAQSHAPPAPRVKMPEPLTVTAPGPEITPDKVWLTELA